MYNNNLILTDWIFVMRTAFIAWHGITFIDENGESDFVRLLFGSISLLFCLRVLIIDVLKIF